MAARDPENFKKPRAPGVIAAEILDCAVDEWKFKDFVQQFLLMPPVDGIDPKKCSELLGNLAAIKDNQCKALALGTKVLEIVGAMASEADALAENARGNIHPKPGSCESALRNFSSRATGKPRDRNSEEQRDALEAASYYEEKRQAADLREKISPLFKELLEALAQERGKSEGRG